MTTCEKCGRPKYNGDLDFINNCPRSTHTNVVGTANCDIASASYKRGLRAGVELAKNEASAYAGLRGSWIDWSDVEAALEKEMGR